jgi:hypothetical protein
MTNDRINNPKDLQVDPELLKVISPLMVKVKVIKMTGLKIR